MFDLSKLGDMVKNAYQMQEKLSKELAGKTVEASSGAGMVKVVMNGQFHLCSLQIEPAVLSMNDVSFLQDLIQSAINDANKQVKELVASQAKSMMA